jgi:hypothetical protein
MPQNYWKAWLQLSVVAISHPLNTEGQPQRSCDAAPYFLGRSSLSLIEREQRGIIRRRPGAPESIDAPVLDDMPAGENAAGRGIGNLGGYLSTRKLGRRKGSIFLSLRCPMRLVRHSARSGANSHGRGGTVQSGSQPRLSFSAPSPPIETGAPRTDRCACLSCSNCTRATPQPHRFTDEGQRVVRFWMRCVATDPPPTLRLTPRVKVVVANAPR